ncbi:phosphoribosyltransferase [Kaistia algarum]|uniref:phosphoribosyltransferase n=1 Tax=Kaistia algarum TaxID=2083279 RepID=UPI000CE88252|nr:phosphoribosyltransferase [Kaistia algarum]MCX5512628.1 phosphoribosyltransferase [Kaistia algarum]PPE81855.1 phosphoribosyltransferase [Kaistia algarum]
MQRFHDRQDAGRRLAAALTSYAGSDALVLALPRGGVPVAAEIAASLGAELDLLLVRKIGFPSEPEFAMGAVADAPVPILVRNEAAIRAAHVSQAAFDEVAAREIAELGRRRRLYVGERAHAPIAGRTVILVDDGIATGATVRAALTALRRMKPARLVLAVPVGAPDMIAELRREVDDMVCLMTPSPFGAIGCFYDDFSQVGDETVVAALAWFGPPASRGGPQS